MPFITRRSLFTLGTLAALALLLAAGFVWSGIYNIGADDTHTRPVYAVLESLRQRSIETRAARLQVPANLDDPARIRQGAGNYDAMCTGCHLAPGAPATELSQGLYPQPPDLSTQAVDAAEAFWVVKHGIKASGMPAWGRSMEDEYIWNMAAFLQQLPRLDAAGYQALVASSGGHSHGGGETGGHAHAEGMEDHDDEAGHDEAAAAHGHGDAAQDHETAPAADAKSAAKTHVHADGTSHVHAPTASPSTAPAATATAASKAPPAKTAGSAPASATSETTDATKPPPTDEHAGDDHHH